MAPTGNGRRTVSIGAAQDPSRDTRTDTPGCNCLCNKPGEMSPGVTDRTGHPVCVLRPLAAKGETFRLQSQRDLRTSPGGRGEGGILL